MTQHSITASATSRNAAANISHDDYQTELALQMAGSAAPRIRPEDILAVIDSETYMVTPSGRTTICELTLLNGFTVRGESSCVSIENFDAAIGRNEARKKAIDKVWELEGYMLAHRLHEKRRATPESHQDRVRAEREELAGRITKLASFLISSTFLTLSEREQDFLMRQHGAMAAYDNILKERIAAFGIFGE